MSVVEVFIGHVTSAGLARMPDVVWIAVTSALSRRATGDRFAKLARAAARAERDRVLVRAIEYCILEQQELTCCARH